ncbi:MAG: hypothetical protein HC909_00030 [Blastochloris sp.]|nr:hypothetical protein [Blastochloris sp.]
MNRDDRKKAHHNDRNEISTNDARGGSTGHGVRRILAVSIILVVAAMAVVWFVSV